jgi:class 3 adenylate cyclase
MHRLFREQLDEATGTSEFVIAQNIDIRGFSDWSLEVDSAQTALYIKKVYAMLIDNYFAKASFVKPTGDGLLVVQTFEENDLATVATKAVTDSMEIVENFHALCDDEDMINFPVPRDVGVGIARGTASKLASAERTLDYSGRVLNLASRLMDLARPRGVVMDEGYGLQLLPKPVADQLHEDTAVLKGIAPTEPVPVHCWPDEVEIPPWHKMPIGEERWEHKELKYTLKQVQKMTFTHYRLELTPAPLPGSTVECEVAFPETTPSGGKGAGTRYSEVKFTLSEARGAQFAHIDLPALIKTLIEKGVKATWELTIKLSYRVA